MSHPIDFSDEELALLLQALEDGITYRDARSHVMHSAVRRHSRRAELASGRESESGAAHRQQARDYEQLALKLRSRARQRPVRP